MRRQAKPPFKASLIPDIGGLPAHRTLLSLLEGRDYLVLTTNTDHRFVLSGFDKSRLFYTQGDLDLL